MATETTVIEQSETLAATQIKELSEVHEYTQEELTVENFDKKPVYQFFKRAFDLFCSLIALVVLFIPMLIIGLAVVLTSKGPMFYTQERVGRNNKPFKIFKFRSMCVDAEKDGAQWAQKDDPRITKVGNFLRKTRLDELPQFINVFLGQMSLVGPRPEREVFILEIEKYIPTFRQRLLVKPGLTGLSQINGQYELTPEERLKYDVDYIKERSFAVDIKCILMTVPVMITHKAAR